MNAIFLAFALAGWGPAGCAPVVEPFAAEPGTHWQKVSEGYWAIFRGNVQIAGYFPDHNPTYRPLDVAGKWMAWQNPPWVKEELIGEPIQNFGVDRAKLSDRPDCDLYSINGKSASIHEVSARLGQPVGGPIPDDAGLLRLTVICQDTDRKKVIADLAAHPALAGLKGKLVVQDYQQTDWEMRPGFVRVGRPSIYLQAASGKVLHRQDEYRGPELLAQAVMAALRKAVPNYDPQKDPDLNAAKPVPAPSPDGSPGSFPWPIIILIGGLALLVFAKSMKAKMA